MSMATGAVQEIVLDAIRGANMARTADKQLAVSADAPLFGDGSPLDSLGLVALLIDVEEAFADRGIELALSDERAMSQRHSPFRSVPALVGYIESVLAERP